MRVVDRKVGYGYTRFMEIREFNAYQEEAAKTALKYETPQLTLAVWALGISGEAGEVAEIIKKHMRGANNKCTKELDTEKVKKELGDVLWYIANMCQDLGFSLQDVAELNIKKLRARHGTDFAGFGDRTGEGE